MSGELFDPQNGRKVLQSAPNEYTDPAYAFTSRGEGDYWLMVHVRDQGEAALVLRALVDHRAEEAASEDPRTPSERMTLGTIRNLALTAIAASTRPDRVREAANIIVELVDALDPAEPAEVYAPANVEREDRSPSAGMHVNATRGRLPCSNCGIRLSMHCQVHVIPCCPGKCPGTTDTEPRLPGDAETFVPVGDLEGFG